MNYETLGGDIGMPSEPRKMGRIYWPLRLLVLIPFVALAWVPSYNTVEPELAGIPFFYWYQLAWIVMGAVLLGVVYLAERPGEAP
jgi:hypothetical protein